MSALLHNLSGPNRLELKCDFWGEWGNIPSTFIAQKSLKQFLAFGHKKWSKRCDICKKVGFYVPWLCLIGLASMTTGDLPGCAPGPSSHPLEIHGTSAIAMQCLSIFVDHTSMYINTPGRKRRNSQLQKTIYLAVFLVGPCNKKNMKKKSCAPWRQFAFCSAWNHLFFVGSQPNFQCFFFWIHFYEILHNVAVNLWEFCFRFAFFLSGGSWWGRKMFRNFQPFWTILVHWDYIYIYCPNKGWIDKH